MIDSVKWKNKIITKEYLMQEFWINGRDLGWLANDLGTHRGKINEFLKLFNLKDREQWLDTLVTSQYLEENYIKLNRSMEEIANEFKCSLNYLRRRRKQLGISRLNNILDKIDLETVKREYTDNQLSVTDICHKYGLSSTSILLKFMQKHGIRRRRRTQGIQYWKGVNKRFCGYEEISKTFWSSCQYNAKIRDLEFNITIQYAWELFCHQQRKCAITGVDLYFKGVKTGQIDQVASLDRKDSNKGYVQDNVWWVHKDVNRMKMEFSYTKLLEWCQLVVNHANKINDIGTF